MVDHRLEILHERFERDVLRVPVGEAGRTLVVTDQPEAARQFAHERRPDRALPVIFDVVQPVRAFHDRKTAAAGRDREVHAVRGLAEGHVLYGIRSGRRRYATAVAELTDEADALALDRLDQPLRFAAIAERLTSGIDAARERGFRNDAAAPDRCDQVVTADHAVAVFDQIDEEVEHLWFDRNRSRAAPQFPAADVDREVFE